MRLGEMLLERQFVSAEDLERALELQKERGEKIGKILIDGGYCAARDVLAALADSSACRWSQSMGPPPVSPETEKLSPAIPAAVPRLPMALQDSSLTLAMADPLDFETLVGGARVHRPARRPVLASEQEILDAIDKYYGESDRHRHARFRGGRRPGRRGPRAPARHGERGAGHPAGERHDRRGGREARQRHSHRAVRERVPHPLSASTACCTTRTRRRAS